MKLIKIEQSENGSHACQIIDRITRIPKGWAVIPNVRETPNLPFGDIPVEYIHGVPTVTRWTPREIPEPLPEEEEPTTDELMDILLGVEDE